MSDSRLTLQQLSKWHGLPVVVSFLGYLPVYLSSSEQKRAFIEQYLSTGSTSVWLSDHGGANTIELINVVSF